MRLVKPLGVMLQGGSVSSSSQAHSRGGEKKNWDEKYIVWGAEMCPQASKHVQGWFAF